MFHEDLKSILLNLLIDKMLISLKVIFTCIKSGPMSNIITCYIIFDVISVIIVPSNLSLIILFHLCSETFYKLEELEHCNTVELYKRHILPILEEMQGTVTSWCLQSYEKCIFEVILLKSGMNIYWNTKLISTHSLLSKYKTVSNAECELILLYGNEGVKGMGSSILSVSHDETACLHFSAGSSLLLLQEIALAWLTKAILWGTGAWVLAKPGPESPASGGMTTSQPKACWSQTRGGMWLLFSVPQGTGSLLDRVFRQPGIPLFLLFRRIKKKAHLGKQNKTSSCLWGLQCPHYLLCAVLPFGVPSPISPPPPHERAWANINNIDRPYLDRRV